MKDNKPVRKVTRGQFDLAYGRCIIGQAFVEIPEYYTIYRSRYRRTIEAVAALPAPESASLLEIGGGQIAMLWRELFKGRTTIWDISDAYKSAIESQSIGFGVADLIHDELPATEQFDIVVLCEVVEHLPVPLYTVLEKLKAVVKPGGYLVATTPNIYRLRNLVYLLTAKDIFCNWELPQRGRGLGHVTEFSAERLGWQAERAGFEQVRVDHRQLTWRASHPLRTIGKLLTLPLSLRARWRDGLVMTCRRPA